MNSGQATELASQAGADITGRTLVAASGLTAI
jgi:hypothetical protein